MRLARRSSLNVVGNPPALLAAVLEKRMQFGICTAVEDGTVLKSFGWQYVEPSVQDLLQGTLEDAQWTGLGRVKAGGLPVYAANMLVPAALKITGPAADLAALQTYMTRVVARAALVGMRVLVFGSGGARMVPEGFSPAAAREQIVAFLQMAGPLAAAKDVTIAIEPLNKGECNILNTYGESVGVCRSVGHKNVRVLVDSYHLWLENEPLENVAAGADLLAHVHVADKDGRLAPGQSQTADYVPLFKLLKKIKYGGGVSVEAKWPAMLTEAGGVLGYLKEIWEGA
jgi:sugar phosphate isomerase/epimerase